jgi:phosphoribosylformimino-5-aminoimidazole carboxamide ribotide isomerase
VKEPEKTKEIIGEFGAEKICLALDVLPKDNGYAVAVSGWKENSGMALETVLEDFIASGIKHILCTDISKDGTMKGCNFDLYNHLTLRYPDLEFQASGGIHSLDDIRQLPTAGAIIGKALYEKAFTLQEALEAA